MTHKLTSRWGALLVGALSVCQATTELAAQAVPSGPLKMVSALPGGLGPPGGIGWVGSFGISISGDGRRVAFESTYPYDPQDTNGNVDIYLYDEATQAVHLVSRALNGGAAIGGHPIISSDGMKVAFVSIPTGLVPGSSDAMIAPVMADIGNLSSPSMSMVARRYDGALSLYDSSLAGATRELDYVLVHAEDPLTQPGPTEPVNLPHGNLYRVRTSDGMVTRISDYCVVPIGASPAAISDDGRYVAYQSACGSIVPGDNNGYIDVFVKDLVTGIHSCVTTLPGAPSGSPVGGSIFGMSGDGSHVILEVLLQSFLGPSAPLGAGYLVKEVFGPGMRLVGTDFEASWGCTPGSINFDGSRVLVCGTRPSSLGGGRVVAVSDLTGGVFQVISRYSDGMLMVPGLSTFSMDWSEDERWVAAFGLETTSPPSSWPPAPMNAFRVDLGPGRNLGGHLAGSAGIPEFRVVEDPATPGVLLAVLRDAAPGAPLLLSLGTTISPFPLGSGVAFSWPPEAVYPYTSRPDGALVLSFTVPPMLPPGFFLVGQFGIADAGTPIGFALSNAAYFNGF